MSERRWLSPERQAIRRVVASVTGLNLGYFFIEFFMAAMIGSVALFADSIDFLEDAAVNLLILVAIGWSANRRRMVGLVLGTLLLVPAAASLWTAYERVLAGGAGPDAVLLSATGLGALGVNSLAAFLLVGVRNDGGSLTKAAFLSARNDVAANIAIIAAGLVTAASGSFWPDVIVGIGIAAMNIGSAREVYQSALKEQDAVEQQSEPYQKGRPDITDVRP